MVGETATSRWLGPRQGGARSGAPTPQDGFSLVECLLATVVLGIAVVTIAGSLGASVRYSSFTVGRAQAEAEARRIAEHLRSGAVAFVPCNPGMQASYDATAKAASSDTSQFAVSVTRGGWLNEGVFGDFPCSGNPPVHRLTVEVTHTPTGATAAVTVAKRQPDERA